MSSRKCLVCEKKLKDDARKDKIYCSIQCKGKRHQYNSYLAQKKRGTARKIEFVKRAGGCCSRCGYDRNLAVLSFHHINPSTKSFGLDGRRFSNTKMELLEKEFTKCELLCMNCHGEHHHPDCFDWK